MLIHTLVAPSTGITPFEGKTIASNCSHYIMESKGRPLIKLLPSTYANFCRVKVRKQKRVDDVAEIFEEAFSDNFSNLRQRSIMAYPTIADTPPNFDAFYVFPINGYKYIYSLAISESSKSFEGLLDSLSACPTAGAQAKNLAAELVKYSYMNTNLYEGICQNSEIIFYGIPCYYAVRVQPSQDYGSVLQTINRR